MTQIDDKGYAIHMRVIHPNVYMKQRERQKRKFKKKFIRFIPILIIVVAYITMAFLVQPVYTPEQRDIGVEHEKVAIQWPSSGSATIGDSLNDSYLASINGSVSVPSASTIKLITALVVLNQFPLPPDSNGEDIYFNADDVRDYNDILAVDGSALYVPDGGHITYRQALDAMLVDSANNIANKLAKWAFGTTDNYLKIANEYIAQIGLRSTKISDASGLSVDTKTSAEDMLKVAKLITDSPTLSTIVKQQSFTFLDGQSVANTNKLLSDPSVIGFKTGNTNEAGFCLVAGKEIVDYDQKIKIYAIVFGQPSRDEANRVVTNLFKDLESGYQNVKIYSATQAITQFNSPWGQATEASTNEDVVVNRWKGQGISGDMKIEPIRKGLKGDKVGTIEISGKSYDIVLGEDIPKPNLWWRLVHAIDFIKEKI